MDQDYNFLTILKYNQIKKGLLPLPLELSPTARTAHIFEGLKNVSLILIGWLCDDRCVAVFDEKDLGIFKRNILTLMGHRNHSYGLWDVTLDPLHLSAHQNKNYTEKSCLVQQEANMIFCKDQTKTKLGEYLHKCAFCPWLSIFLQATTTDTY